MTISPSDNVAGKISEHRTRETPAVRLPRGAPASTDPAESTTEAENGIREIRKQIVVVQCSLSRFQSILGGLEAFRAFLDPTRETPTDAISRTIGKVSYRGEAVLEPYRETLQQIAAGRNEGALEKLILDVRRSIEQLAVRLSRFETAEQNSRSLSASAGLLSEVLAALKNEGTRVQGAMLANPEAENVLDLLT